MNDRLPGNNQLINIGGEVLSNLNLPDGGPHTRSPNGTAALRAERNGKLAALYPGRRDMFDPGKPNALRPSFLF